MGALGRNGTKPVIPGIVDLNDAASTFKLVLVLCAILFTIAVLLFSSLRLTFLKIYAPRLLLVENKISTLGSMSRAFFSWIKPGIMSTDDDIYKFAGIDALVFIRFLKLVLKLSLLTLPYGMIVLLPLNIYGGNGLIDDLDKLSMSNVKARSSFLWAHCLAVWFYSIAIIYLTFQEWKVYIKYRQNYLKTGFGFQFVVLVQNIPAGYRDEKILKSTVEKLFPNKVSDVHLVKNRSTWMNLIKKHDKYVLKWERVKHHQDSTEIQVKHRTFPCGPEYEALAEYEEELKLIQDKLIDEQNNENEAPLSRAFVFLKSLQGRAYALQTNWFSDPLSFQTSPAPAAHEILWYNLKPPHIQISIRRALGSIFVFALVLFWAIPITFISSLTKLQSVAKVLNWKSETSLLLISFIEGVVPVLLISLFYLVLPYILRAVGRFQGKVSKSKIAMMVFKCLFIFQTFNTFFIYIISGSVFEGLHQIINKPFDLPYVLAKTLPSQADFFLNYLALVSFVGLAIELTRILPFIWIMIKLKWFAKTQRDRLEAWKPPRAEYEILYSRALLFFLIGISYSILSPIIIPFFVLTFAFSTIVWTYQLLHVYISEFDHGGKFWPEVFYRMMACVVVFQVLMIGVFFLKLSWAIGMVIVPLVIMTLIYCFIIRRKYKPLCDFLVLNEAIETKFADQRFLEGVKNEYVDHDLPDVYEMSGDGKRPRYESYVPIDGATYDTVDDGEGMQDAPF